MKTNVKFSQKSNTICYEYEFRVNFKKPIKNPLNIIVMNTKFLGGKHLTHKTTKQKHARLSIKQHLSTDSIEMRE